MRSIESHLGLIWKSLFHRDFFKTLKGKILLALIQTSRTSVVICLLYRNLQCYFREIEYQTINRVWNVNVQVSGLLSNGYERLLWRRAEITSVHVDNKWHFRNVFSFSESYDSFRLSLTHNILEVLLAQMRKNVSHDKQFIFTVKYG